MVKTKRFFKNKAILIILAILILCGIIAFITLISMYSNKTPSKAVYVLEEAGTDFRIQNKNILK